MGYGKDKPLLYYASKIAKENGYEIMNIEYDEMPPVSGKVQSEMKAAFDVAYASAKRQLDAVDWADKEVVFIAKSVGTIVASKYAFDTRLKALMIMFTPLDNTFDFMTPNKMYYFTGENDPWIDHEKASNRCADFDVQEVLMLECNHSLEVGRNEADLDTICEVMRMVRCIFNGEDIVEE